MNPKEFPPDKIEQAFKELIRQTQPNLEPASNEYKERRHSFMAGAFAMFYAMQDASDHPIEDICVARVELLNREMNKFVAEVYTQVNLFNRRN